jgi:hypothetical protein
MSTKLQKFKVETVHRSAIHGAPYNPRQIDEHAKSKLRANIKRVGLLVPILVNRRTGNVVSGHQRLAALDALEGKPDYDLQVSYCELTEKQEREQNIFMNNESAMGTFDTDALTKLVESIDIGNAGFDKADLEMLLPDFDFSVVSKEESAAAADVKAQEEKVAKMKEQRKKQNENYQATEQATQCILTLVFKTRLELDALLKQLKLPNDTAFLTAERFFDAFQQINGKVKLNSEDVKAAPASNGTRKTKR